MSEFDKIIQDAEAIVAKEDAEQKRLLEEQQRKLEQAEEQKRIKEEFAREEAVWDSGELYNQPEKFKEYLQKGHKPTFNSCGGRYEYYNELASARYAFYKNPHFEEIFDMACTNGLGKSDAEKLLKFAFTPEAINILVEKGGADIQNYPLDKIDYLYAQATGKEKIVVNRVPSPDHTPESVLGHYLDPEIADGIENALREIIKRGYDINKSPQNAKALTSLLQNIQLRKDQQAKRIAEEKRKLEEQLNKEKISGWNYKSEADKKFLLALADENWEMAEKSVKQGANVNMCLESGITLRGYYGYYEKEFGELDDTTPAPSQHYVAVNKFLAAHGGEFATDESKKMEQAFSEKKEHEKLNQSKLAEARNKAAKKVDKVLGTNLEKRQIFKSVKKIEKFVSDKLLGKVKE